jgi:SAM-dependent methyltransferase
MDRIQNYTAYQLRPRGRLRQFVRNLYLARTLRVLKGRTIDFGCGAGELLQKMSPGSIGLEINPVLVEYCRDRGMDVRLYNPKNDGYKLVDFIPGVYTSLVLSHVLEHLDYPAESLRSLLQAARRLGLRRVVVIVPGKMGFISDPTHKRHIDAVFLKTEGLLSVFGYQAVSQDYFPGNMLFLGNILTHHELRVVYELISPI